MSVQKDNNAGFELYDTEFPELSAKMTGRKEKGRRSAAVATRHARQAQRAGAQLVKTIDDPNNVLGKRRKERLSSECNDGFSLNVIYSMNKNNRWNEINTAGLLKNQSALPVAVVERVTSITDNHVRAIHTMDDEKDEIHVKTATGKGTALKSILIGEGKKHRGRKARKEAAADESHSNEASSCESEEAASSPKLQYTILTPHVNQRVFAGKAFNHRGYDRKKAGGKIRAQQKMIDMDDLETSELEQSVHITEDDFKPSRDARFCLGDYLPDSAPTSKTFDPVFIRRQSIESVKQRSETIDDDEGPKPSHLLDISPTLQVPHIFESIDLDVTKWKCQNFSKNVEEFQKSTKLPIQWLDADKTRVSIDASQKLFVTRSQYGVPSLIITVEKTKAGSIRVICNSDFKTYHMSSSMHLALTNGMSLEEIVTVLGELVNEHKDLWGEEVRSSRCDQDKELFLPKFNSTSLARPVKVLSEQEVAKILREEEKNSRADIESFERVDCDFEDSDIEMVQNEENESPKPIVGCISCDNSDGLFELDDCWQCRDCLRDLIVDDIRAKRIPLSIQFVLMEGQSMYDILPAIIPMTLFNLLKKMTITEIAENSDIVQGELGECPSCKHYVRIERLDKHSACICSFCGIHWCPDCGSEPHFPMKCSKYAEWIKKWQNDYQLHYLEKNEKMRKIKCYCGYNYEIGSKVERTKCKGCGLTFNPQTMELCSKLTNPNAIFTANTLLQNKVSVETVPAVKAIRKEFSDLCGLARKMRFDLKKTDEFEKAVRKLKNTHAGVEKLKDVRLMICLIVENGLGFVYSNKDMDAQGLKQNLTQLMKQWMKIEEEVQSPRHDFSNRIDSITAFVPKSVDLIKTFIE